MQEFILRDGEIAFNNPDGTVVIMNTNTYLDLKKREQAEEHRNEMLAKLAILLILTAALSEKDEAEEVEDAPAPKRDREKFLTQESFKKWARLPENEDKATNKTVEEEPDKQGPCTVSGVVPNFAVPGNPWSRGLFTIVASDGRIFRSGAEAEEFYDLPYGSVSAFFCGRQKYLYQGYNSKGNGPWYHGKKIGLARTRSIGFSVNTAKEYRYDWIAEKMEKNYALYRTLCREAEQTME